MGKLCNFQGNNFGLVLGTFTATFSKLEQMFKCNGACTGSICRKSTLGTSKILQLYYCSNSIIYNKSQYQKTFDSPTFPSRPFRLFFRKSSLHNVDKAKLKQIADLARLEILPEKQDNLCGDIENILSCLEMIKDVKTNVEPLISPTDVYKIPCRLRDDKETSALPAKKALENAVQKEGVFFVVPNKNTIKEDDSEIS